MGKSYKKNKNPYAQLDDDSNSYSSGSRKKSDRIKKNQSKNQKKKNTQDDYAFRQSVIGESLQREINDMEADGNCLFRSLSDQLYRDYGKQHEKVRHEICHFLVQNKEEFSIFLLLDDDQEDICDFESYVSEMRKDGTWGGDVEIVCAARLYKRRIKVYSAAGAYKIDVGDEILSGPDLLLSFHDNNHYNSVHDSTITDSTCTLQNEVTNTQSALKKGMCHTVKQKEQEKKSSQSRSSVTIDHTDHGIESKDSLPTLSSQGTIEENQTDNLHIDNKSIQDDEFQQQGRPKRNQLCSCGSGLRYKKCCAITEKRLMRLQKFKEKHGIVDDNMSKTEEGEKIRELDGGFVVLNI